MKKLFLLGLILCQSLPAQAQENLKPQVLNFYVGGFLGSQEALKLNDGQLNYTLRKSSSAAEGKTEVLKISDGQWQNFRKELDKANVWAWPSSCFNPNVSDGTQWELEITYGDKTIKSSGSNSYPIADGKCNQEGEFSPDFKTVLSAVKNLTGKDIR